MCAQGAHVDHVTGGVVDLDAIADAIRLADENIDPGDETFHRRLHSQTDDDRSNTERGQRRIPIHKDDRRRDDCDQHADDQLENALECETRDGIQDPADCINPHVFGSFGHDFNLESDEPKLLGATRKWRDDLRVVPNISWTGQSPSLRHHSVFAQQRRTSATLHACAMQPPGRCGSRASKTSLIVPMPASSNCSEKRARNFRAPLLVFG